MLGDSLDEKYEVQERVGQGAFGEILRGIHLATRSPCAIKRIPFQTQREQRLPKPIFREMESLRQLQPCAWIVQLFDVFVTESALLLVLEYVETDLSKLIANMRDHFTQSEVKYFSLSLFKAIAFCHAKSIIHRDIKPSNVLISQRGEVKLCDFGLARVCVSSGDPRSCQDPSLAMSHQVATRWYRPPELLFASRHYGLSMDIWSAGGKLAVVVVAALSW